MDSVPIPKFLGITPRRHCERSEAIQASGTVAAGLDCFVASLLAMTMNF
jgi:hypothetical protein